MLQTTFKHLCRSLVLPPELQHCLSHLLPKPQLEMLLAALSTARGSSLISRVTRTGQTRFGGSVLLKHMHKPGDGRKPNVHGTHTDELPAPSWAPSVPSELAITNLQPHSEAPVRQQVDAPLHHIPSQLSMAWHSSFSFWVRAGLWLSKGNLIWKTKPLLKP
ncbi:LOW QUALITY PROTEIN: hypothetical protein Nmel_014979 [Mimus melanotis]